MQLLVTGGLGFIGSNFILNKLNDNEHISITNVDAEFFGSNHENLIQLKNSPNYKFVKGNSKWCESISDDVLQSSPWKS
jgi:dTDP-glucose 4,6-dehydratase